MSRKRKYSDEFRLILVDKYFSGKNGGFKTITKKYGINHSILERWVHLYETHGSEGLCSSLGTYSGKFKSYVVEYMHMKEISLRETANYFCIPSAPTVAKWH